MKRPPQPNRPSRLVYFTPLRYPGGKAKLAGFVKALIRDNGIADGHYVEPYAGGAGIGLELLFHEYVSRIYINDVSRPIHAFWNSVLNDTENLVRRVRSVKLSVSVWDRQKKILANPEDYDDLELGFATFYLNRTNRSGILNGGIIGGRDQSGPWKIDARYNRDELAYRIEEIAKLRSRIVLSRKDAMTFLKKGVTSWPDETLIYLDPPYYVKGRDLYLDYYEHEDHARLASFVKRSIRRQKWIVSYDDTEAVRKLYSSHQRLVYSLQYSAREAYHGGEVMFFSSDLEIPKLVEPMRESA